MHTKKHLPFGREQIVPGTACLFAYPSSGQDEASTHPQTIERTEILFIIFYSYI
jgi:hypothetical protein